MTVHVSRFVYQVEVYDREPGRGPWDHPPIVYEFSGARAMDRANAYATDQIMNHGAAMAVVWFYDEHTAKRGKVIQFGRWKREP